ncbi:MAG: winged helix-turn-helix transcriptional regulator [Nanoarchaeota archaeon]
MESEKTSPIEVLELEDASRFAKTVSSSTSKKILTLLEAEDGLTASEISSKLDMALSTVHYHLKSLCEAGVVDDSSFHYSEKGKEVIHYSLHDKAIIIIPRKKRSSPTLKKQLQSLVPGILVTSIIATGAFVYDNILMTKDIASAGQETMYAADTMAETASAPAKQHVQEGILQQLSGSSEFLIGVIFSIIIIILSLYIRDLVRKSRNR